MDALAQREQRAIESILENESLTADLDDGSAQALLDWGIACVRAVVRSSANLSDAEVEDATSPRLRATRQLMRGVRRWVVQRASLNQEADAEALEGIIDQARVIFGAAFSPPPQDRREAFVRLHPELADDPRQMVASLRQLIEDATDLDFPHPGGDSDQEIDENEIHI